MKNKQLKFPVMMFVCVVALTMLQACKPADNTAENKPADQPAKTSEAAAPAVPPVAPAAPNTPAAPTPAPAATPAAPAAAATPAGMVRYDGQPTGSTAKIEGTSTVHDWHMDSSVIGGFMEVDAKFP